MILSRLGMQRVAPAGVAIVFSMLSLLRAESRNFVSADPQAAARAEESRVRSALFWTGRELPAPWSAPCPIVVRDAGHEGCGAAQFVFDRGEVSGWRMTVEGSRASLLNDVIPHEVDHMVRASLVRRPIERWLDEGCAMLMESAESHERSRKRQLVPGGQPLEAAFLDGRDYPRDSAELERVYTVGFSLVEFLLDREGPRTLLAFQRDPRRPSQKLAEYYGFTAAALDAHWREWRQARLRRPLDCASCGCAIHRGSGANARTDPPAAAARPPLLVFTSEWCGPCRRFWSDWKSDERFRTAIERRFSICAHDVDRDPQIARQYGVDCVPTFIMPRGRIAGYEGKAWLLARLSEGAPSAAEPASSMGQTSAPASSPSERMPALPDATERPGPTSSAQSGSESTPPQAASEPPRVQRRAVGPVLQAAAALLPWAEWIGVAGGAIATGGMGSLAIAAVIALLRRRLRRRAGVTSAGAAGGAGDRPAPFPRALDEARQLLELRQSEGRVAVLDALRGMLLEDEAGKAIAAADARETAVLKRFLAAVDARVQEIAPLTVQLED